MKKMFSILCALLLVFVLSAASADTVRPKVSETLKNLLNGKTYYAAVSGWGAFGEGEDTEYILSLTISEEDNFDPQVIDNLKTGDEICFGYGNVISVKELVPDEFGVTVKGDNDDVVNFYRLEDGSYVAHTDTDYPFWTDIFTVEVPLEKDIKFKDWSDPENLESPVELGLKELVTHLEEETDFAPYNTKVTFDENGKLIEFLYSYSPWN